MTTDKIVKGKIRDLLIAGSGTSTTVIARWKLALKAKDWTAILRSVTVEGVVNGWYLTRTARRSKKIGTKKWEYEWDYALWYFKTHRDNGKDDNSEDEMHLLLEACVSQFEDAPMLNLDIATSFGVDRHSELQVINIDTLDNTLHIAQCKLTVYLTQAK